MTAPVVNRQGQRKLVVATIVVIVASAAFLMLLPALGGRPGPGRSNVVAAEIKSIESGLAAFKEIYGIYPPSGLVLYRSRGEWESDPQSMSKVRQIWPKFDFDRCEGLQKVPAGGVVLNGPETLVFFLGGIRDPESGELTGFSKNPASPFAPNVPRETPIFEFMTSRLVDIDGDGYPEYCDLSGPDSSPIVYACKWEGRYRPADYNQFIGDVYRRGREVDSEAWCRDYQLISAGRDGKYGTGGYFSTTDPGWASFPKSRADEFDNRANFGVVELGEYR